MLHCAADGLALGSAALSGDARLNLLVTLSMLAHKAPMAAGLATYLQGAGLAWRAAQRPLLLFSATAPAAAVLAYLLLGSVPTLTSPGAVALVLLFSGGTFLHAATSHILPDVLAGAAPGVRGALPLVLGAVAPLALQALHPHGH